MAKTCSIVSDATDSHGVISSRCITSVGTGNQSNAPEDSRTKNTLLVSRRNVAVDALKPTICLNVRFVFYLSLSLSLSLSLAGIPNNIAPVSKY